VCQATDVEEFREFFGTIYEEKLKRRSKVNSLEKSEHVEVPEKVRRNRNSDKKSEPPRSRKCGDKTRFDGTPKPNMLVAKSEPSMKGTTT